MTSINNVKVADIGYYINLDHRPDRDEQLTTQLNNINFSGIERYSAYTKSNCNVVNCSGSHFELYQKLVDSDHDTMLILEDDCLFLDSFISNSEEILNHINSVDWDIFWLGARQRRSPKWLNEKIFQVSSVSHSQSYLINKRTCLDILKNYYVDVNGGIAAYNVGPVGHPIDEFLCLYHYGYDMVKSPNSYNFYESEQPLDDFDTHIKALCYERALTTQYLSTSDITPEQEWNEISTIEAYISNEFRTYYNYY